MGNIICTVLGIGNENTDSGNANGNSSIFNIGGLMNKLGKSSKNDNAISDNLGKVLTGEAKPPTNETETKFEPFDASIINDSIFKISEELSKNKIETNTEIINKIDTNMKTLYYRLCGIVIKNLANSASIIPKSGDALKAQLLSIKTYENVTSENVSSLNNDDYKKAIETFVQTANNEKVDVSNIMENITKVFSKVSEQAHANLEYMKTYVRNNLQNWENVYSVARNQKLAELERILKALTKTQGEIIEELTKPFNPEVTVFDEIAAEANNEEANEGKADVNDVNNNTDVPNENNNEQIVETFKMKKFMMKNMRHKEYFTQTLNDLMSMTDDELTAFMSSVKNDELKEFVEKISEQELKVFADKLVGLIKSKKLELTPEQTQIMEDAVRSHDPEINKVVESVTLKYNLPSNVFAMSDEEFTDFVTNKPLADFVEFLQMCTDEELNAFKSRVAKLGINLTDEQKQIIENDIGNKDNSNRVSTLYNYMQLNDEEFAEFVLSVEDDYLQYLLQEHSTAQTLREFQNRIKSLGIELTEKQKQIIYNQDLAENQTIQRQNAENMFTELDKIKNEINQIMEEAYSEYEELLKVNIDPESTDGASAIGILNKALVNFYDLQEDGEKLAELTNIIGEMYAAKKAELLEIGLAVTDELEEELRVKLIERSQTKLALLSNMSESRNVVQNMNEKIQNIAKLNIQNDDLKYALNDWNDFIKAADNLFLTSEERKTIEDIVKNDKTTSDELKKVCVQIEEIEKRSNNAYNKCYEIYNLIISIMTTTDVDITPYYSIVLAHQKQYIENWKKNILLRDENMQANYKDLTDLLKVIDFDNDQVKEYKEILVQLKDKYDEVFGEKQNSYSDKLANRISVWQEFVNAVGVDDSVIEKEQTEKKQ